MDVIVRDRAGKPVRGLTAADFEIRDNGEVQPITNFAEYGRDDVAGTGEAEGPGDTAAFAPIDRRTIVLFIEKFAMQPAVRDRFFTELKGLLREVIRPGDAAAIVTWNYVMKVRQDFTDEMPKLEAALDSVAQDTQVQGIDPESMLLQTAFLAELLEDASIIQERTPVPTNLFDGREQARHALVDIRRKTAALNSLVNTMAGAQGRRILFMATHRFSQYAGAEYFGGDVPIEHRTEFDTYDIRKQLWMSANASSVTIYPIYPGGADQIIFANAEERTRRDGIIVNERFVRRDLDLPMKDAEKLSRSGLVLMNETAAITEVATATGGVAAWGKTDIVRLADTLREDMTSYYSLAFRAAPGSAGKARKLTVITKNRSYQVRARREYVEKTDNMRMRDRVLTGLYARMPESKIPFDVRIGEITRRNRRYRIPVEIRIPVASLTTLPGATSYGGSFSVFAAAGGRLGVMSEVVEKSQQFTVKPEDAGKAQGAVLTYKLEMIADGRADRIGIGVMDGTSREWGVITVRVVGGKMQAKSL